MAKRSRPPKKKVINHRKTKPPKLKNDLTMREVAYLMVQFLKTFRTLIKKR